MYFYDLLHEDTGGYKRVTRGYRELKGLTGGYKGLQGLQGLTIHAYIV